MPAPTREQAIATLERGHSSLMSLLDGLPDEQLVRAGTIGGGDWSAKDLMGHIAFWEELALEAIGDWRAARRPAAEAIFEQGVDAANAQDQARWAAAPVDEVRARARKAHESLLKAITELSDGDWRTKASYPTRRRQTLAVLLGSVLGAPQRPFGHTFAHLPDLEAYVAAFKRR